MKQTANFHEYPEVNILENVVVSPKWKQKQYLKNLVPRIYIENTFAKLS